MDMNYLRMQFFGGIRPEVYLGGFFFTLIVVLFMKRLETKKKVDATDIRTPDKWSLLFMVVDNLKDIIQILTLTFLLFRFSNSTFTAKILVFDKDTDLMLYAVLVGFLSTYIITGIQTLQTKLGQKLVDRLNNLGE